MLLTSVLPLSKGRSHVSLEVLSSVSCKVEVVSHHLPESDKLSPSLESHGNDSLIFVVVLHSEFDFVHKMVSSLDSEVFKFLDIVRSVAFELHKLNKALFLLV